MRKTMVRTPAGLWCSVSLLFPLFTLTSPPAPPWQWAPPAGLPGHHGDWPAVGFGRLESEDSGEPDQDLEARLQEILDGFHQGGSFPGASAAVSLPDGSVIPITVGEADTVRHVPLTPAARMLQGSVGKTYFAALAMQLVDEGKLELDASVSRYLGRYPWFHRVPNAADITVRQLMTHTSGVMRYEFKEAFTRDLTAQPDKHWRPEELVSYVLDEPASFPAGQGWEYSDTNFILLGMILEEVSGEPCYALIQRRVLDPLGLENTVPSNGRRIPGLIMGYAGPGNPFGGTDEVLIPTETEAGPAQGHSGFFPGYLTEMAYFPELDVAVALQMNTSVGRSLGRAPAGVVAELALAAGGEEPGPSFQRHLP